jgi:DNA-directed RNA polymerase specialized sigma24 family protein
MEQNDSGKWMAGGVFATTHWSVVARARDGGGADADAAMERLFRAYWYPLYVFVRRKGHGHEDACDLTQAFFAKFLEKHYLRSVETRLGKFRTFLLASLTHFLANEWDRIKAQRRGGGCQIFSLDEANADERYQLELADTATPELLFERRWARTVLGLALDRLATEINAERFGVLKDFLLEDKGAVSYAAAAAQLGLTEAAVTSAIYRMRGRFRALMHEEISHTVETQEEVGQEIRHLLAMLSP